MWKFIWLFLGFCRVRITGASPQWALNRFAGERIAFRDTKKTDDFTIETSLLLRDLPRAAAAAERGMCDLSVLEKLGAPAVFGGLRKRALLLVLLFLAAASAIILPKFVWFYEVSGNHRVPSEQILRNLRELGVGVGSYGPSIRPQWVKNHMLARIPELQWIAVTQNGAVAKIIVRERPETEPTEDRKTPRNVIASRDGLLTRVSVLEGGALCKPGDVVTKGQLLVSAYTDYGYATQVSAALAEIYARTWRRGAALLPDTELCKRVQNQAKKTVSLIIGQKRKIIFGNSGISTADCDKMTTRYPLTLPGGHALPIAVEITVISGYQTVAAPRSGLEAEQTLEQSVLGAARDDMIAGTVLKTDFSFSHESGAFRLASTLECEEMIARMVDANLFRNEGKQ
jgi:similar to stage IV sporulation protein